jgi:signal transduction histidine kinase
MSTGDPSKTRAELIGELARLRRLVADLESAAGGQGAWPGGEQVPECSASGQETGSLSPLDAAAGEPVAVHLIEHPPPARVPDARRRPSEEVLRLYEQERRLIAYEIHDGLIQEVTGAQMQLEALAQSEQVPPGPVRDQIELALELIRRAVREGRRLINGLRPAVLDELGVVAAIDALIQDQPAGGPSIEFVASFPCERLEPFLEMAIYRIAQEAITNVRRHSQSDRAEVRLARLDDRIRMEIRDEGVGFAPARIEEKRLGLQGIRERARLLGGRAEIDSAPGEGARVFVDLPLAQPDGEAAITKDRSIE